MSHDGNETHSFRFLSLSDAQVAELREHEPLLDVSKKAGGRSSVTTFFLRPESSYDWLRTFISRHSLEEESYGVFTSLATEYDSEIISLPPFVRAVIRSLGGRIEFSFTVLSED